MTVHSDTLKNQLPPLSGLLPERQRILALHFPYLAPERILRQRHGRSWRLRPPSTPRPPLALSHRDRNAQRIAALDERAQMLGLKRGMGLADARAMQPSLDVVEADPAADHGLLSGLADWCDRYTPLVALDGDDGLFLDITGCAHLFGCERALMDDLVSHLLRQGFDARAALASTAGMAWAAARFRPGLLIEPDEAERFLFPMPLPALRLADGLRAGLEAVGLRTVGDVMATPRAPLVRRFGRETIVRLDQALGHVSEPISPRLPVPPLSVERRLAEPIVLMEDVERLVLLLAGSLRHELLRRGEGARVLDLALFRVDGAVTRLSVGASRALRDPAPIGRLFREKLACAAQDFDAGYGFDLVRLSAPATVAIEEIQNDLTGSDGGATEAVDDLVDRIRARFGESTVLRPVAVASHLPERAVILSRGTSASMPAPAPSGPIVADAMRPVRLFRRPEPVAVTAEVPDGPPLNFRWRRVLHRVVRAEGPERIAPEWWREKEPDASEAEHDPIDPTRDYFRVEDGVGHRYWLFREGLYAQGVAAPSWYLHGLFA